MVQTIVLNVNGHTIQVEVDPQTPLLYVLRDQLQLKGAKYGCGSEQCGACKVLIDGADVPSCQLPVGKVEGLKIVTVEGLGTAALLHPLQEAFIEEQAIQCGYCAPGMIIAAQGLLNRTRYPTDDEIREALDGNLCRCGVYERIRRAIKLRIGRPEKEPVYEVIEEKGPEPMQPLVPPGLPVSIENNPELDSWIRIDQADTITVFSGKAEIGQGIKTALAQIAADELGVSLKRIRMIAADTAQTPDEGVTAGSMSMHMSGNAIRWAAAEARTILLAMAFEELESVTPVHGLRVEDGTIIDPATGRRVSYWDLSGGKQFHQRISGKGHIRPAGMPTIIGDAAKRIDLARKVTGSASFVHDMELPDMVHGRVIRPPRKGVCLRSIDEEPVRQKPGILKIVRDGSFLAVIAEDEDQAIAARELLAEAAVWEDVPGQMLPARISEHLLSQPAQSFLVVDGTAVADPIPPKHEITGANQVVEATYTRPYQMHASLGPSAAVAQYLAGELTVWSHSQGVFLLQQAMAEVLGLSPENIRVIHVDGAGCYGHNAADDAAFEAALLALALPGRPVSLKWMRDDEHKWEPYGSAMVVKLQASLARDGQIAAWHHDVWGYPQVSRPRPEKGRSGFLASWTFERPWPPREPQFIMGTHFGNYRNADPLYSLPNKRIVTHFVPNSPLRTSSMRGLGAYANVFAIESFIDELAFAGGVDPIEYRLRYLLDERARAVIEAAARKAQWQPRARPAGSGQGRGLAFAQYSNQKSYCAVIVELTVGAEDGQVRLQRATIAADAGQIVNPDGISNQLEGGFVQAASWTLLEEVVFDQEGIQSKDWDSYPILHFSDSPEIQTVLINRPQAPFLGVGEAAQGPTAAAIANAIFDATGIRFRDLPLTRAKILEEVNGR